jgi:hypothetical protein
MSRSLLSGVFIASILSAAALAAQTPSTLTDKDRAEIQDLVARYQVALSTCASQDYAALFTPDGVFASDDFRGKKHREMYGPNGGKLVGRAKIAELVETEEFCLDKTQKRASTGRPAPAVTITATPQGVTGTIPLGNGGRYDDVYVKTSEGWRFKTRTVTMPPRQQSAAPAAAQPMTLGPMDIFEIQQLVARYSKAIDSCSNNGYDYADLFTEDGFFAATNKDGAIFGKNQGRDKLAEVSGGGVRGCKNVRWIENGRRHVYVNQIIEATPEGAKGTVDMLMMMGKDEPGKITHEGYYEDTFVKTPKGWRFKSRIHHGCSNCGNRPAAPSAAK